MHHGLWRSGSETVAEATRHLIAEVAALACVQPGDQVCDVGCGYGAAARVLVEEYGASVTALTVSQVQYQYAVSCCPGASNPAYVLRDWLKNGLRPASFDVVIAIESTEHMADLGAFYQEVARVLKPGGRLVVCAWLTREAPRFWERRLFLEPICREGRLRGMGSASEYQQLARASGLVPVGFQDVSRQVKRTWPICARRVLRRLVLEPSYRRFIIQNRSSNKIFALTIPRIWVAYELGCIHYGILTTVKPGVSQLTSSSSWTIGAESASDRPFNSAPSPTV